MAQSVAIHRALLFAAEVIVLLRAPGTAHRQARAAQNAINRFTRGSNYLRRYLGPYLRMIAERLRWRAYAQGGSAGEA